MHAHAIHVRDHEAIVSRLDRIAVVLDVASIGAKDDQSALPAMIEAVDTHLDGRLRRLFFFSTVPHPREIPRAKPKLIAEQLLVICLDHDVVW